MAGGQREKHKSLIAKSTREPLRSFHKQPGEPWSASGAAVESVGPEAILKVVLDENKILFYCQGLDI